ncbi:MAG: ATP-binding protein [bacterium]|nr:ATP-binding protein [bacterium]
MTLRRLLNSVIVWEVVPVLLLAGSLVLASIVRPVFFNRIFSLQAARDLSSVQERRLYEIHVHTNQLFEPGVQSSFEADAAIIQQLVNDFGADLLIWRTGDVSRNLAAATDVEVLRLLDEADQQWLEFQQTLDAYLAMYPQVRGFLDQIEQFSDLLAENPPALPSLPLPPPAINPIPTEVAGLRDAYDAARDNLLLTSRLIQQRYVALSERARQLSLVTLAVAVPFVIAVAALAVIGVARTGRAGFAIALTARKLAAGDLTARARPSGITELGDLSAALNHMAASLQARQEELLQANAVLEERVKERTRELEAATEVALEHSRLKSAFMATMSHELRTPLNAITGYTSLMLMGIRGQIDEDARRMLERVLSNSDHLLGLINQLLDLAKIEAAQVEIVNVAFDVRTLVSKWHDQMRVLAEARGLSLTLEVDPALPEQLCGDPDRLTQMGLNLLSNAIKFTQTGEVSLALRHVETNWSIIVRDTGVGIPPHALNYIFEEFRQVDHSYTREQGGTGLGLAITRNLARLMQGEVTVTSEMGVGSTFTITLPLIVPASEAAATHEAALHQKELA